MKNIPATAIASDGNVGEYDYHYRVPGTNNIIVVYYCKNTKLSFRVLIENFDD